MIRGKARHQPGNQRQTRESLNLAKEVRTIQHRAADHDGRIVSIGPLVFFSTNTGDAWMLAPADHLAVRLALAGDPLPVLIEETEERFAIGWLGLPLPVKNRWTFFPHSSTVRDGTTAPDQAHVSNS